MNKADTIRLNQRWISETDEKIEGLNAEIAVFEADKMAYRKAIARLEEVEE
jgi:hypothetical protein